MKSNHAKCHFNRLHTEFSKALSVHANTSNLRTSTTGKTCRYFSMNRLTAILFPEETLMLCIEVYPILEIDTIQRVVFCEVTLL
jgi:hypothetical protein